MRSLVIVAALCVASCADVQEATPAGGILRVSGNRTGKALVLAQAHCARYGKDARISGQNAWNNTVTFDCVPRQ